MRALALLAGLTLAGCSFLCTNGDVSCVDDGDCGVGYQCVRARAPGAFADAGFVSAACQAIGVANSSTGSPPGASTGSTAGSASATSAGNTGGNSSNGSTTGQGSGTTGTTGAAGSCSQSQTGCCGNAWGAGVAACDGLSANGGQTPGSLYLGTNDGNNDGIYVLNPNAPAVTEVATATLGGGAVVALTVIPASSDGGQPSFVYAADNTGILLVESGPGGEVQLPQISEPGPSDAEGLAFIPPNTLAIASGDSSQDGNPGVFAYAYPPGASWSASWMSVPGSSNVMDFAVTQLQLVGPNQNTLVGASVIGPLRVAASTGDICYTEGCDTFASASGRSALSGVAVDGSTGTTYLTGADGSGGGLVLGADNAGNCLFWKVGTQGACSNPPFSCLGGTCSVDASLAQRPLNQAGFVGGTLYVTPAVSGGSLYSYSPSGGLQTVLSDHTYFAVAVGP